MTDSVGISTATTPGAGDQTFGRIKNRIATYYGLDKDPDKLQWIGEVYHDILDEMNTKKLWDFNLVESDEFSTVVGQENYSVPGDLWRLYSVRKQDSTDFLLTNLRQRDFDIIFQGQLSITGLPFMSVTFNIFRDGTIKLFPTPDAVYTILIRYYKLIAKPGDKEVVDLPRPYQVGPLYGTLARVAMMVGESTQSDQWERKYQMVMHDMMKSDEDIGDEDLRLKNVEEMGGSGYLNPNARPRFLDLY